MKKNFEIDYPKASIRKDEEGYFFEIGPGKLKIYVNEILEEFENKEIGLHIGLPEEEEEGLPYIKEEQDIILAKKVMEQLNLKENYPEISDNLNVMNWLIKKYTENPPKLRFQEKFGKDNSYFKKWQTEVQQKVKELLRLPFERCPLHVEWGPSAEFKGVLLTKVYFTSQPGLIVPAILAKPKLLQGKAPAVICLHGHNFGKICAAGFAKSASHSYYGLELAMRGYVTLSIDQFGSGERYGVFKSRNKNSESDTALSSLLLGMNAIGIRVWDVIRALDFLETLDFVDNQNLGVIGQSGGGTISAFSGAMDSRIKACVISGYFCSLFDSIFTLHHCACNYIPDILQWVDIAEVVGTRAPSPTFIVSGRNDAIFPQNGVQKAYSILQSIYRATNAESNLDIDVWENHGHEFTGRKAYPWLDSHLHLLS